MLNSYGTYQVFTRNWWKYEYRNGKKEIVPGPGRKTILGYTNSEQDARTVCKEYNDTHKPGPLSRKAEYTSSY